MRWQSVLSRQRQPRFAAAEAAERLASSLGDRKPDLLLSFVHPGQPDQTDRVASTVQEQFPGTPLIGCSAGGVVGAGQEVEHEPALSLTGAVLPGVRVRTFQVEPDVLPSLAGSPTLWYEHAGVTPGAEPAFLLLPDALTCDARALIESLDDAFPDSPKAGGLASGGRAPGENALFLDGHTLPAGAVGAVLSGEIRMDTIVAQGCRPVGSPMFVTWAEDNLVHELDGKPVTEVLTELYGDLSPRDQQLAGDSLFLGVVMTEGQQEYDQGDFLIRNLVGLDPDRGILAVGEHMERGQVVQFHLRDAETSAHDLEALLGRYRRERHGPPRGALLFSCLGRGRHLYGERHHDSRCIARHLGDLSIGGFFCNGEIGPVGGRSFLHGYTSSIALFHGPDEGEGSARDARQA